MLLQKTSMDANSNPLAGNNCHKSGQFAPSTRSPKEGANAATTFVVDYARSFMPPFPMKEFPVSTRTLPKSSSNSMSRQNSARFRGLS